MKRIDDYPLTIVDDLPPITTPKDRVAMKQNTYYWVSISQQIPEIVFFSGNYFWPCGSDRGINKHVEVLKEIDMFIDTRGDEFCHCKKYYGQFKKDDGIRRCIECKKIVV